VRGHPIKTEKHDGAIGLLDRSDWTLDYKIPESRFSEAATGTGTETFRQALNDKYVYFDYSCSLTMSDAEAHGIFAWDRQVKAYRYWWFKDSGSFSEAAGDFIDNDTRDQPKVVPYRRGGEARNDQ